MVQVVTLPFGALNAIPGLSGIEDVELRIPEPEDIIDPLLDEIPTVEDLVDGVADVVLGSDEIRNGLLDVLEDISEGDPLPQAIAEEVIEGVAAEVTGLEDVEIPDEEDIADAVAARINIDDLGPIEIDIQGSLFAIEQDLLPLVEELLGAADLSGAFEGVPVLSDLADFLAVVGPFADEFADTIGEFIDDPAGTATRLALDLLRAVIEEADLVSDEAQANLEAAGGND